MLDELIKVVKIIIHPFVVPLIVIAVWVSISYSMAKNSGWKKLREHFSYKTGQKSNGQKYLKLHAVVGKIGKINYRGMLKVGTIAEGIVLKVYMPWLIGHPMLLIPWSSIAIVRISKPQLSPNNFLGLKMRSKITKEAFFAQYAEISLKEFPDLHMSITWHSSFDDHLPDDVLVIRASNHTMERDTK